MNFKLEAEFSKADILQEVDALKKQIDDMRPLSEDVEGRVMQKLRLDWNYHSNAIEGNRLSYGETVAFLMEGITAKGKPLKDHLDIRGHNEAINFLLSVVKETRPISEADIRNLHKLILVEPYNVKAQTAEGSSTTKQIALGEYKTSPNHVKTATGETHYYATPEETPAKMQELMEWYGEASKDKGIDPVVLAALFHHKFVAIHPFDDGNGRLSRILMNLILMQKGYPPVVIKMDDRQNYYSLLSRADSADNWPFIEYIAEQLLSSLNLYLNAANGEDIDEDEDIDKDIALFKLHIQENPIYKEKKSSKNIINVVASDIYPLVQNIFKRVEKFDELFTRNGRYIKLVFNNNYKDEIFSAFNQSMVDFISSRYPAFTKMEIYVVFKSFKSMKKTFDMNVKLTILFKLYHYEILSYNNKLIIKKKYHEKISDVEKKIIVKDFIEGIKSQINLKITNSKSG